MPNNDETYVNKVAIIQTIGGLATDPMLFNKYKFCKWDFPEEFYLDVFKAILGITSVGGIDGKDGVKKIDPIDVDTWLRQYPIQYQVYQANDGSNWLRRAIENYDPNKFSYHYHTLRKYGLTNRFKSLGFDVSHFIDASEIDPDKISKKQAEFDQKTEKDIVDYFSSQINSAKKDYISSDDVFEAQAGDGIWQHVQSFKENPDVGLSFVSPYLTAIFRGQRLGTLMMESSAQGVGKSRRQISEAAHLAVPEYYDLDKKEWVKTGYHERVLHISTELSLEEVQDMWIANISGVEEDRLVVGDYSPEEGERIKHACDLISKAKLFFVSISNFDIDDIIDKIQEYVTSEKVRYVYFDYLSSTEKLLAASAQATHMAGLREDQILLTFSIRLKDLAKIDHIFIYTATQISGNWKEAKDPDQQMIRGAKSLSDKIDGGWILLPVRHPVDDPIIEQYQQKGFVDIPTHVLYIYKNRKNKYTSVRVYGYFQRNISRWKDCFVTDSEGKMLDISPIEVRYKDDTEETPTETETSVKLEDSNNSNQAVTPTDGAMLEAAAASEAKEAPAPGKKPELDSVDPDIFHKASANEGKNEQKTVPDSPIDFFSSFTDEADAQAADEEENDGDDDNEKTGAEDGDMGEGFGFDF